MSEFINTIDVLGDDAVVDSIIDRTITEFKDNVVTQIGHYAFYGSSKLEEVDVPMVTDIGGYAFNGCTALKSVSFPLVTSGLNMNYVFNNCTELETVNFPALTFLSGAFGSCASLKRVCFPNVTGDLFMAFSQCRSLEIADFPVVTVINGGAFQQDVALKALILRNTKTVCELKNSNALSGTSIANGTGFIYVPRALVDSYKVATNWSVYASQFRPLEDYTVDGTITGELDETKI